MGAIDWLRKLVAPTKLTTGVPVVRERALHEQFQRIGGGLTPLKVSQIVREADAGRPGRLVDLGNEARQKDGHLQSVLSTRDGAVASCELDFVVPERPNRRKLKRDKRAVQLCHRVVEDFENWPTFIEHLTGSYFPGHATAEVRWKKTRDGLLLPYRAEPIFPRHFVFSQADGQLRYSPSTGVEVDLLAENPGRIVQIQRRIVGDVPCREGLIRLLAWASLLRNWTLTDWIALGEVGWKPWRIAEYEPGTPQEDIDALVEALENIGATGVAAIPKTSEIVVEWPKGNQSASRSTHHELHDALGREISKAVLGQTTTVESGPNGDRAAVETRDNIRLDKREQDAVAVAAVLKSQLFNWVVALNLGDDVLVPTPWFQTDEATDQAIFALAVQRLVDAGVRTPAQWVRDEIGMPNPKPGDEIVGDKDGDGQIDADNPAAAKPKPANEDDDSDDAESGDEESDTESDDED